MARLRPLIAEHVLAWSYTRHRLLSACERATFWTYIGSWGHGLPPGDPDGRRAFALKQLTTLPLLVGTVVHAAARQVVEAVVHDAPVPGFEALHDAARFTLNQAWRNSQPDQIDRFWQFPAAYLALQEIVERGILQPWEIGRTRARLEGCLHALAGAPVLRDLAGLGDREVWLPPAGPIRFTPLAGEVAWGAVDLAYLHRGEVAPACATEHVRYEGEPHATCQAPSVSGPTWCVADWKTGALASSEEEALQLGVYGLWLESAGYPKTDDGYLGRIVDLTHREDRWYRLDSPLLSTTREVIVADIARVRGLMADPERAIPRPKHDWALANDRRGCPKCRFHSLCAAELEALPVPASSDAAGTPAADVTAAPMP